MSDLRRFAPLIHDMLLSNVIFGPALSSVGAGGLDSHTYRLIYDEALLVSRRVVDDRTILPTFPTAVIIPKEAAVHAVAETIASTAAYLSHLQLGYLNIDDPMVKVASRLVEKFVADHDALDVIAFCVLICAHDDYQVLDHYKSVPEQSFISGELHRPWIHYTLENEVLFFHQCKTVDIDLRDGKRTLRLTEAGRNQYSAIKSLLRETGFTQRRSLLMRWSQFSQLDDYDTLVERLGDWSIRGTLLEYSRIQPGMNVLELGCGTGTLTLDSRLYERVGPAGRIMATDPSIGMLARAKRKLQDLPITNVQFIQAPAEELPFEDNSFDAVTGCSFLHFADIPATMREIYRVARPNAVFSTVFPLSFPHSNEFFAEWFKPVLSNDVTSQRGDMLPGPDDAPNAMRGLFDDIEVTQLMVKTVFHHVETVVKFYVQVINAFETAMNALPWKAKQEMIDQLVQRGHQIIKTYPAEQLTQLHPTQMIRAHVVKGAK